MYRLRLKLPCAGPSTSDFLYSSAGFGGCGCSTYGNLNAVVGEDEGRVGSSKLGGRHGGRFGGRD